MGNCFDGVPHENIDFCPNDEIASGISVRAQYIPVEFVETFKLPPKTGTYAQQITVAAAGIVLKKEKGWKGIDLLVDENELKTTFVGNRGNKKEQLEFDAFIPGFRPKVLGFLRKYKNAPLLFNIQDNEARNWLIGTKLTPAYFDSSEATTGKKYEDNSGVTIKIMANTGLYLYAGEVKELADKKAA